MKERAKTHSKKVYIIGIDSAPLWIIKKLSKKYNLKGFERFFKENSLLELRSTIPPVTSVAWPSIYTGLEPKAHGIIDFSRIEKDYNKELTYYDQNVHRPFWDILAGSNFRSLVVTPAVVLEKSKEKNVDMITGWPLQPRYSSKELEESAKRFSFEGEPDIGQQLNKDAISLKSASSLYAKSIEKRAKLSEYLIKKNNYELSFVCFTETDRIQHYSLNLNDWETYVAPLYKEISNFIEFVYELSSKKGQESLILVVSDHGAQPIGHKFLTNSWLVNEGFAKLKESIYKKEANMSQQQKGFSSKIKSKIVDQLVENKFRRQIYEKMPKAIKKAAAGFVEESFDYESGGKYLRINESDFNMNETKAFSSVSTGPFGMIWINDKRFSSGNVSESEKVKLKGVILKKLKALKILNGKPLIKKTYKGYDYYSAKAGLIPPDIIFEVSANYTTDFSGYLKDKIYAEPEVNRRGEHTSMGIFGALQNMKGYKAKSSKGKELYVCDVFPIILNYFEID